MWRFAVLVVAALAVFACGGGEEQQVGISSTDPALHTPTEVSAKQQPTATCLGVFPEASLSFEGDTQSRTWVSANWHGPGCALTGHPSFTLPLPIDPLRVPIGAEPQLRFTDTPARISAFAWLPDFSLVTKSETQLFPELDEQRAMTRVDLPLQPTATQLLSLDLPPGDYAVEIFTAWPEGSTGYAFHVEIIESEGVP